MRRSLEVLLTQCQARRPVPRFHIFEKFPAGPDYARARNQLGRLASSSVTSRPTLPCGREPSGLRELVPARKTRLPRRAAGMQFALTPSFLSFSSAEPPPS